MIDNKTLEDEEMLSKIVEGMVNSHLAMSQEMPVMRETRTFLWFYYDARGRESDNVMKLNRSFIGIETKYRSEVGFKDILKIPQIGKYIIFSKEDIKLKENILVVPSEIFMSLLNKSDNNL